MKEKVENIKNKILEYVKGGEIKMKPKWHFQLKQALLVLLIIVVYFTTIYFINFISLVASEREVFMFKPGIKEHFFALPWFIIILVLVLLILLELLISKFSFVYKKPLMYSILGLILFVVISGFTLLQFDRGYGFARFGEKPGFPFLGPMHMMYRGEIENRPFSRDQKFFKKERRFIHPGEMMKNEFVK